MATVDPGTKLSAFGLREATRHALADNGAATVADLLDPDHTRDVVASWSGIGASRLADLDAAMGKAGLAYGKPISIHGAYPWCGSCTPCPDCGNPRTSDPRQVVVDQSGRAGHHGHRVGPVCTGCDKHHRALFTADAA